jgi:hypothetical protein
MRTKSAFDEDIYGNVIGGLMVERGVSRISVDEIHVLPSRRAINEETMASLATSRGHHGIFPKEHAKRRRGTRRGDFVGA